MSKLIKIYGERNTNTNYLSKLIKLNLSIQELPGVVPLTIMLMQIILPGKELVRDIYFYFTYSNNLGWKHTRVKPVAALKNYDVVVNNDLVFLSITKNPYSWLLSLYRRPYEQYYSDKLDFESFLQRPWKTNGRENAENLLKNPIELWNIKNSSYLQLSDLNGLNLTTESIFQDPKAIIDKISNHFSVKRLSDEFINYKRSTKEKNKDSSWYRDYYLNEKWQDEITNDAIAIINETVDKKLMSHFGYSVLP